MKLIFILFVLLICTGVYVKFKNEKESFALMVSTALITTIIGNLILPSNISLFDAFNNKNNLTNEADLYISEENNASETTNNNIAENYDLSDLLRQIEQECEHFYGGGGWVTLSLRKKLLQQKQAEYENERKRLADALEEANPMIEELDQQISQQIQNTDIKME